GWLKQLSMMKLLTRSRINFMGIRKPVFVFTVTVSVLGVLLFLARGKAALNMDFVGGTVYGGELTSFKTIDELRAMLDESRQQERLVLAADPVPVGQDGTEFLVRYQG